MYFLTDIDPRAAIKGSRDPLGLQPIWTRMGREVVGNLTTVTTSARNFSVLMLGLYFAEDAIARGKAKEEDRAGLFMKFEQLAAYSRAAHGGKAEEGRILGITRVKKRLDEKKAIRIRAVGEDQILSNQKTYGIWGLYSVASASSGVVQADSHRLSPQAQDFLEEHTIPALKKRCSNAVHRIRSFVAGSRELSPTGRDADLSKALAATLAPGFRGSEREFYAERFVTASHDADATHGRQATLWGLLADLNDDGPFAWREELGFDELVELRKRAAAVDEPLADRLHRIEVVEPLFATAARLFGFVLAQRDARPEDVAEDVQNTLGKRLAHLHPDSVAQLHGVMAEASTKESADHLVAMARQLHSGDYEAFVDQAMGLNAMVMKARGGAPWVERRKGRLHVRLRSEQSSLPSREQLPTLWANSYFLNSLKVVGAEVVGKR